jgi:catechol-2,3-dioxygenase
MNAPTKSTHAHTAPIPPSYMAHFVIRTSRYQEIISWYRQVLHMRIVFSNELLTFLSFDREHHRLAIINIPDLQEQTEKMSGLDHVAYSYRSLEELIATYERLKLADITPVRCINHGPTTSLYYRDPDGGKVEMQVDNFATLEEAGAFLHSATFAANPIGVDFDPDVMGAKLRSGVPAGELLKQGSAPARR